MTQAWTHPLDRSLPREAGKGGRRCAPAGLGSGPSSNPARLAAAPLATLPFQGKDWSLAPARGIMR
jgi:hypothetical protein